MPTADEIQTIFDRIAPAYDRLNDQMSFGLHHVWKLMAVKWCAPQPGETALDLCCGTGDLALLLRDRMAPTGRVIGVDFSAELLNIARERAPNSPQLTWQQANVLNLPFVDNFCDRATMGYGLRNVVDIPACLAELWRVLKQGGTAVILDFHRPQNVIAKSFQDWYLANQVVPAAQKLALTEEYAYISPSLERFPQGPEQVKLAQTAGFEAVHYPIFGGLMGVLVLTKPQSLK